MIEKNELPGKWYADLYDKEETQTEDIDLLLEVVGNEKKNILEVCCGSGRILIPLAKAGHQVTGFDINDYMLANIENKLLNCNNIKWYKNDAILDEWGQGYDVVVLAGNILINIETELDYKEAQELLIQKAYDCLRPGGFLFIDFYLSNNPKDAFGQIQNRTLFEGLDRDGNYGCLKMISSSYDCNSQIALSNMRMEYLPVHGHNRTVYYTKIKYIPTLEDVITWLEETGFEIDKVYGDYRKNEISELTSRAVLWAKKGMRDGNS